ncbi:MAG: hypothetical protein ACI9QV_000307 [Methylophagaceae bacterium]|jgi:predicted DNA-binding ribbon-helix-helix protein
MVDDIKKNKKARSKKMNLGKSKASPDIKKNTSLRLEKSVLKQLKIRAIEDDTSVQQLLEILVTNYLGKSK